MKRLFLFGWLLMGTGLLSAQQFSDVLRYSNLSQGGTARFLGAGGAFGALGAEFSTLSQNPAGLAMYRTDELVFTPALKFAKADATLGGKEGSFQEERSNFGFDNFGMVFNTNISNSKWKTFNFGIGVNKMRNYSQSVYYEGLANGTIMNGMFDDAYSTFSNGGNENDLDPYWSKMAWDANAIYAIDNTLTYDFAGNTDPALQRTQLVTTSGRMNEMVMSFAGNFDEKLMLGATIGVPFVNYRLDSEYKEEDQAGLVDYFERLTYTDYLRTEGVGINGKFGLIYRASQAFRIGAAVHTPTLLGLTDSYSNSLSYTYTDGNGTQTNSADSGEGRSDYRLRTPWRAIVSTAIVVRKLGFISADVELVDYSANKFNLTADVASTDNKQYERELNNLIQRQYQQTVNVRLGGELALNKLRLRAGVNLNGKPEEGATGFNTAYTGGIGVRGESFYLDLGYRRYTGKGNVSPYAGATIATTDVVNSDLLMTVGIKF